MQGKKKKDTSRREASPRSEASPALSEREAQCSAEIDKAIRKATDKHSARVQGILDEVAARTVQHRKRHG
jgi:hypothetical protein